MAAAAAASSLNQDLKQESQDEHELKIDHFGRLPDDAVMLIINKLIHMKTLIRFSLVSKRYLSLVPLTDSLVVDFNPMPRGYLGLVGGFLGSLLAKFTRFSRMADPFWQKLLATGFRFRQVKHLHFQLGIYSSSLKPSVSWVAVIGSDLELCHVIASPSVSQSDVGASTDHIEALLEMLKTVLKRTSKMCSMVKNSVSHFKMLETVVFSDYLGHSRRMIIMKKELIARLKGNQEVSVNMEQLF